MPVNRPNGTPIMTEKSIRPAARWIARAPGRVNIIGEHVDYNDGWVLPMAIEREIIVRATARPHRTVRCTSQLLQTYFEVNLDGLSTEALPSWGRYIVGAIAEFQVETGASLPGFDAVIESTVPQGGGLSSSAALCVAITTLLEKISGRHLAPIDKALLCQRVEHRYAGVPCGLMDQVASVMCRSGHLLLLDCKSNEIRHVPLGDTDIVVLVTHSGVSHDLADGAYARRREECAEVLRRAGTCSFRDLRPDQWPTLEASLSDTLYRRARHVISESQRTLDVAAAVARGDWEGVGARLYESHTSLARDYEVSCPELDFLVATARELGPEHGVVGARMTGGGFGGSTVTLVRRPFAERVAGTLQQRFKEAFGHAPASFLTQAAEGAE